MTMSWEDSHKLIRIRRLLVLIFPVSILVDLISGFCTVQLHAYIPISQFLRIVIMTDALYLLTKRVRPIFIGGIRIPIFFFILISPFWMIIGGVGANSGYNPVLEIEGFSKILYFFVIVTFFIVYRTEIKKQHPLRIISNYGLIIAVAVIISFVTGYGNYTYGVDHGFGTKSYFKAGNDLGLTILYASVASSLYMFFHYGWKQVFIILTISLSAILIGTRVGLIGIAFWITVLMCYIVFIYRPKDSRMRKRLLLYKPVIILGYAICVIEVIKFLLSAFNSYMLLRYTESAMMSARSLLTTPAEEYITKLEWYEFAFGKGVSSLYYYIAQSLGSTSDYCMVEADFHELLGGYGLVGFLVFISPFAYFMIKAVKRYILQPNFTLFAVLFVTASFLAVAYAAGHCFRNTMVAPIYGYVVSLMYDEKKRSLDK